MRIEAERERVTVTAVGPGHAVGRIEDAGHTNGDRFLARVEMRRAMHLTLQEQGIDEVLELADEHHPPVQLEVKADLIRDA